MQKFYDTVLNAQGQPVSGATVSIYDTGTSTLSALYEDDDVTGKTNPLTTDSAGLWQCKVADGIYDIVVTFGTSSKRVNEIIVGFGIADGSLALAKLSNGTANKLLGFNGSGAASEVSVGTGLSLSGGTLNLTLSGDWELVSTASLSSSSSASWTGLSNTYKAYCMVIEITSMSGTTLGIQGSTNNGSTWVTSAYLLGKLTGSGTTVAYSTTTTASNIEIGTSIGSAVHGIAYIFPVASGNTKIFGSSWTMLGTDIQLREVGGYPDTSGVAVNAVRLIPSSGTLTGRASLYRMK